MFARDFDKSPKFLGIEDIRNYQLYLTNQKKPNASSIKVAVSAIRFLCRVTLGRPWDFDEIVPSPRSLGPCRSFSVPRRSCIFSAVSRTHRHVEMEPMPEAADKDYRDIYEELTGVSLCQCPACRTAIRCCSAPFGRSPRFH